MRVPSGLREFVKMRPEVEAVVQHVGLRTWDLVLIDVLVRLDHLVGQGLRECL